MIVSIPGFGPPPIICGYNTGQHMWVPASDSCVTVTLDIDTATTTTTRKWDIRVTQYECGNLMAPEENCLQYHTATTGFKANNVVFIGIRNEPLNTKHISIFSFSRKLR